MAIAAAAGLLGWLYLFLFRGGFWRADQRLPDASQPMAVWPAVTAVIPARDEAATIGAAVRSLLAQSYCGDLDIVVVDDESSDDTAAVARAAGGGSGRVTVISAEPPPPGWTGKLNALAQGLGEAKRRRPGAAYALLSDADIVHAPDSLAGLVGKAEAEGLDLVSLMARLRCETGWEKLLVPAFVFYFQKLYPFAWVNDRGRGTAAAAGGCSLVRRQALEEAGGIAAIRDRLIDDCALAALIKRRGPIWLGLTDGVHSVRAYAPLRDFWAMVARTAFTQLEYSWYRLAMAVAMMTLLYAVPPLAFAAGSLSPSPAMVGLGAGAWLLMVACMRPTLRLYGLPAWRGALLPVAGVLFTAMTIDSARHHIQGRGGLWKGRPAPGPERLAGR